MSAIEPAELIDHHCHGVVTEALDRAGFEALLTESPWPPATGTSMFDSQLGFAVRRWCAPLLGLEPSAPAGDYLRRRAELGPAAVTAALLRAAGVSAWLVDTGYQASRITGPAELSRLSGAPAHPVIRLEAVAEQIADGGTSAGGFGAAFAEALARAAAGAAGLKSIAAYRCGLGFEPSRPGTADVRRAAARWLRERDEARAAAGAGRAGAAGAEPGTAARLADPALIRHVIWTGVDTGLPVQFHTGFGDPDARLPRADPALLHDFLLATRETGTPVVLLHCYPYHRQAGYLANVFPHAYLDVGEALNHVGARSAAVLAEALELAPPPKMLYSSDAFGLPELHYLGAARFRRDLGRVLGAFVADGDWTAADARRAAELIGSGNARRVYRLDGCRGPRGRRKED